MLGKWDFWYRDVKRMSSFRYGNTVSYSLAEEFLKNLEVEDWGCGTGAFKRIHQGPYIGVDGSKTPFVDKIADLRFYKSRVDGIMMRHILEHNYDWEIVLKNALASFKKRFCLIIFTPFRSTTKVIDQNKNYGVDVPTISFRKANIEKCFGDLKWSLSENIKTQTRYGAEHIYFVEKSSQVAVITADLGSLKKPPETANQTVPSDYFHFNDKNYPPRVKAMTPELQTKIVKMFSWQLVPGYDYYLWVGDTKFLANPNLVGDFLNKCKDVAALKNNSDVFMYRNCDKTQKMLKQWWQYTSRNDAVDEPYFGEALSQNRCKLSVV